MLLIEANAQQAAAAGAVAAAEVLTKLFKRANEGPRSADPYTYFHILKKISSSIIHNNEINFLRPRQLSTNLVLAQC